MIKTLKQKSLQMSAATVVALMAGVESAHAQTAGTRDMSTIAENIITSIEGLPGLLTGLSYMLGILLGVLGILKIKDHVENPSSNPIQHGAVRLAAGGALIALPIVYEAMLTTIGDQSGGVTAAELSKIDFAVN